MWEPVRTVVEGNMIKYKMKSDENIESESNPSLGATTIIHVYHIEMLYIR